MNIALPALVVLIGLLPGIAAYYAYFNGRFEKRRAGVSALEEAALYVLFSIPIDTAAYLLCRSLGYHLDIQATLYLLSGAVPDHELTRIAGIIRAGAGLSALMYLGLIGVSAGLGVAGRWLVERMGLDSRITLFRWRHPWYYLFQARGPFLGDGVLAYVDILVEHAEDKTRLYRGLVSDYDMAADGKLESITLIGASRAKGRGDEFRWMPMPSDHLVILGCKVHSINVTYFDLHTHPDEDDLATAEDLSTMDGEAEPESRLLPALPSPPSAP